jgi:hypothetical protein
MLHADSQNKHMMILELIIVILFMIDLAALFLRGH